MHHLLANISRAFWNTDEDIIKKNNYIITPTLKYAAVIINHHVEKIAKVQRAATKWVTDMKDLSYEERLDKLKLPTLEEIWK